MVLLQPLPAFLWLGLTEQATPADAKAAFRRLSKRQHPDAGGDAAQWRVTLECRELLKDSERLEAYVLGRNHREYVRNLRTWDAEGLSQKERVARMTKAVDEAREAQERNSRKKAKTGLQPTDGDVEVDPKAGSKAAQTRLLDDKHTFPQRMPKPSVQVRIETALAHGGRRATLVVEIASRLSEVALASAGYEVQTCRSLGRETTPWGRCYRGKKTRFTHVVDEPSSAFVAIFHFRVRAWEQTGARLCEWSDAADVVLSHGSLEEAGESREEQRIAFRRKRDQLLAELDAVTRLTEAGTYDEPRLKRLHAACCTLARPQSSLRDLQEPLAQAASRAGALCTAAERAARRGELKRGVAKAWRERLAAQCKRSSAGLQEAEAARAQLQAWSEGLRCAAEASREEEEQMEEVFRLPLDLADESGQLRASLLNTVKQFAATVERELSRHERGKRVQPKTEEAAL